MFEKTELSKEEQAAIIIQKHWRASRVRNRFGFSQLSPSKQEDYAMFLVGNDPKIEGLGKYKTTDSKAALIGTSGLRSLALICELGSSDIIPKLIIVDNSRHVVSFWRALIELAASEESRDQVYFVTHFVDLILKKGVRSLPDEILKQYETPGVAYENQNAIDYILSLFDKHGYDYVRQVIKHSSVIAGSWADTQLFNSLKNILEHTGVEVLYAYPSNIAKSVPSAEIGQRVMKNTYSLNPRLIVATDLCPYHGIPEHVSLIEGKETSPGANPVKTNKAGEVPTKEMIYHNALNDLKKKASQMNSPMQEHVEQIINEVEKLQGNISISEMTVALKSTALRLDGEMPYELYKNIIKNYTDDSSHPMQKVGVAMATVGIILSLIGIILATTLNPAFTLLAGVGVLAAASGFYLAGSKSQSSLEQSMNDINDSAELYGLKR